MAAERVKVRARSHEHKPIIFCTVGSAESKFYGLCGAIGHPRPFRRDGAEALAPLTNPTIEELPQANGKHPAAVECVLEG